MKYKSLKNVDFGCHARGVCSDKELLNFMNEYLGKIETDFENVVFCLSGVQKVLNDEKIEIHWFKFP